MELISATLFQFCAIEIVRNYFSIENTFFFPTSVCEDILWVFYGRLENGMRGEGKASVDVTSANQGYNKAVERQGINVFYDMEWIEVKV